MTPIVKIALPGGGPSALLVCKRLLEQTRFKFTVDIFEAGDKIGAGMPYSRGGANPEHVTNVSANEIPELFIPLIDWLKKRPDAELIKYNLDKNKLSEYRVLPRLLFGDYLSSQFDFFLKTCTARGIETHIHYQSLVTDIEDNKSSVALIVNGNDKKTFDKVIICTGHNWPKTYEGKTDRYFDSPYPPSKLQLECNHKVAIRGSSLTAIDALKTLARHNGEFVKDADNRLVFNVAETSPEFGLVLHSVHGLLPGIRFHVEEPLITGEDLLTPEEIANYSRANGDFLPLDIIFNESFKKPLKNKRPEFYESIKDMSIEEFVDTMLSRRENIDPFVLFQQEYEEAERSIALHRSVYWKEMLSYLSFAMNYPAKHFSAEDMLRLQKILAPLIAVIIAFVPQGSCDELLALYRAGRLELRSVDKDSRVEPNPDGGGIYIYDENTRETYLTFVDSIGQKRFSFEEFPFKSLLDNGAVSPARLKYKDKDGYFDLPGVAISDEFKIIGRDGTPNDNIFIMAVPYISGHNPDYSGLDFCAEASHRIVAEI